MKKIILCALICCPSLIVAQSEITRPNMDTGYWVVTVDQSDIIEKTLASMPESTRDMMRGMMEERMQDSSTTEQCMTEEILNNFDKQIEEAFGDGNSCELDIIDSTSDKFSAIATCSGVTTQITTTMINSKRNESVVISNLPSLGETRITTVAEWQSDTCPEGL